MYLKYEGDAAEYNRKYFAVIPACKKARGGEITMNIYTSNAEQQFKKTEAAFYTDHEVENHLIKVYTNEVRQEILGFGGALTEASAYTYSNLRGKLKNGNKYKIY
jgi:hypothetical protein